MRYLLLNITTLFHQSSGQQSSACAARLLEAFPFILLEMMLCWVGCEIGCSQISQCSIPAVFRFGYKNVGALSHGEKTHEKGQCHSWVQRNCHHHLSLNGQKSWTCRGASRLKNVSRIQKEVFIVYRCKTVWFHGSLV